jgi:glycerate dehydrogenase
MRIVVLDGYTLNPGDLSWQQFESLGECVVYDRTPVGETVARSMGAEMLFTNKTALTSDMISQLPDLDYIGVLATGYNVVAIEAAAERQIPVTNVPEYGTQSVAQMVFAHLLNFSNHVAEHSASVKRGAWSQSKDFCFWEHPLMELSGRTMGIVGLGRIGAAVATAASAFGMDVLAHDPMLDSDRRHGIVLTDLKTVFRDSDVVSLHCPLTEHNQGFVNAELLGLMKQDAFLINTSRGPLVDETALADALNQGTIAGAGIDVLAEEPPAADCPLLTANNCYLTPHIAWATLEARRRLLRTAFENAEAFLHGNRIHVVNGV